MLTKIRNFCTAHKDDVKGGIAIALVLAGTILAAARETMANVTVTLPSDFAPQAVVTDVITNVKDWVLIGGIAIIGVGVVVGLIRGLGKRSARAVK